MNKILTTLAILALASGTALAQRGEGSGKMRGMRGPDTMNDPSMRGREDRPGGPVSEEMRAQMRAERDAIRDIVGAIRVETDDSRKAELTGQLRTKLGSIADRMQAHQEERLAQAEERLSGLKERIEHAKANRDSLIEEEVQRLLSGERPGRPASFDDFPYAKGGMRGHGQGDGPGKMRGPRGPMPPPGDDMDDMPPPPEE